MRSLTHIKNKHINDPLLDLKDDVEQIIRHGADRGMHNLISARTFSLHRQIKTLLKAKGSGDIALLTGFPIVLDDGTIVLENDGPIGTGMLAAALSALGYQIHIITDSIGQKIFDQINLTLPSCAAFPVCYHYINGAPSVMHTKQALKDHGVRHLIAIERPGAAKDGAMYNMRGQTISAYTTATELLFKNVNWRTSAFADGGNEIGFGCVGYQRIAKNIQHGKLIASRTKVNYLTLCGVSNWGAYGFLALLCAGLPQKAKTILTYLSPAYNEALFDAVYKGGGVDGVTKKQTQTVDNLPLSIHNDKIMALRACVLNSLKTHIL